MPAVPNVAKLDVNLDENVDGSPYDVCLWHQADIPVASADVSY